MNIANLQKVIYAINEEKGWHTPPLVVDGEIQLPHPLRAISAKVHRLAHELVAEGLGGPEFIAGLRKLLEAKDCFVRAKLPPERAIELPDFPGIPFVSNEDYISKKPSDY